MTRLLLPLEHPSPTTEHDADTALLHGLKRLPRRVQQVFLLNRLDQLDFAGIAAHPYRHFNYVTASALGT